MQSESKTEKRKVKIKLYEDLRIKEYVIIVFDLLKYLKGKADINPHLNL